MAMLSAADRELLTIEEVAKLVGLSAKTVGRCIDATEAKGAVRPFPGWKLLGRKRVVPRAALDRWIAGLPDA